MIKKILPVLLLLFCGQLKAQKTRFFQKVEVVSHFYFDDIFLDKKDWRNAIKTPAQPLAHNFDSLSGERFYREAFLSFDGGYGMQLRLQKELHPFAERSRSFLQWSAGIGYRYFKTQGQSFSTFPYLTDTTKTYLQESELFNLKQHYVDVYNSFTFTRGLKYWRKAFIFIGAGLQFSLPVSSTVKESYRSGGYSWNTPLQRWVETQMAAQDRTLAGRRAAVLSWSIPIGSGIHLSDEICLTGTAEYFKAYRLQKTTSKNYSEGGMFSMAFSYRF